MQVSQRPHWLIGVTLIAASSLTAQARQPRMPTASTAVAAGSTAPLPDFADCSFASGEPDPDWFAVVHEGGTVRALDRRMPAFGDALTPADISLAISHIRTFCTDSAWPQGDLNVPRAFFTEKAFPENEAVWAMAVARGPQGAVENELIYEWRLGARNQIEIVAPIATVAPGRSSSARRSAPPLPATVASDVPGRRRWKCCLPGPNAARRNGTSGHKCR